MRYYRRSESIALVLPLPIDAIIIIYKFMQIVHNAYTIIGIKYIIVILQRRDISGSKLKYILIFLSRHHVPSITYI